VVSERHERGDVTAKTVAPDVNHVIIAAARQVTSVRGPGQPTDVLGVAGQGADVVVGNADVVVVDFARS